MKEESKGLYAAILLSVLIIFGVNYLFPAKPDVQPVNQALPAVDEAAAPAGPTLENAVPALDAQPVENALSPLAKPDFDTLSIADKQKTLSNEQRIKIETPSLNGSLRVKGARFDYLSLTKYKQTQAADSPDVELLFPSLSASPYFAELGWLSGDKNLNLPNAETVWSVKGNKLTPQTPVTLEWNNGQGLKFIKMISVDENYLFNVTQTVENNTGNAVVLYPYGLISRSFDPEKAQSRAVIHEGVTAVVDNSLKEFKYKDLKEGKPETFETTQGWAGFSDRYWFTAFILNNHQTNQFKFANNGNHNYQVDFLGSPMTIAAGGAASEQVRFFAGAKEIKLLDQYADSGNIKKFDLAVDFGWYYFLTKPFFYILTFLYGFIGNMGWAILLFAALLRLAMFPIANKSYESMSKMKKVQPKIAALQEQYKDNKAQLQQATMELYRREKINPASGCLPMLIQIPVFFSLYKVLNISIEIRHAPFIGWIKDLSAPDPLTISAWSHLPVPGLIDIGVWPILMGLTMWIQQKLNPAPANKDQARMFALMPLIFTFMLGHFASGLVIYWTLSNILSILQQKAIMRKNGVK